MDQISRIFWKVCDKVGFNEDNSFHNHTIFFFHVTLSVTIFYQLRWDHLSFRLLLPELWRFQKNKCFYGIDVTSTLLDYFLDCASTVLSTNNPRITTVYCLINHQTIFLATRGKQNQMFACNSMLTCLNESTTANLNSRKTLIRISLNWHVIRFKIYVLNVS